MVTKGGHLSGSGLYGTSRTIGRGVTKLRKSSVRENMGTSEYTRCTNILTYRRTQPLLWGGVMYLST